MARPSTRTPRPTEQDCTDTIIAGAQILGFIVHHCRPARALDGTWRTPIQGNPGFPDLIIAGHGHVLAVELKRHPNKVQPDQRRWLDELAAGHVGTAVVFVPDGQQGLLDQLARLSGHAT